MNESRPGTGGKGQPSTADTGTAGPELLAHALGAISRDLQQQDDPDSLRAGIVAAAVAVVPGAEEGSISVVTDRRRVGSQAATSDLPARVDTLQEKTRQGPCLDAVFVQQTVRVADMATEQRWPLFAQQASAAGAAGMLSLQLFVEGDNLGADRAFLVLARTSQHTNRKLHDIADELCRTGATPTATNFPGQSRG